MKCFSQRYFNKVMSCFYWNICLFKRFPFCHRISNVSTIDYFLSGWFQFSPLCSALSRTPPNGITFYSWTFCRFGYILPSIFSSLKQYNDSKEEKFCYGAHENSPLFRHYLIIYLAQFCENTTTSRILLKIIWRIQPTLWNLLSFERERKWEAPALGEARDTRKTSIPYSALTVCVL